MLNLLLIGGLPPPVGGTTVLFKQLVDDLRSRNDICLRVIDVSRPTVARTSNVVHALRCLALLFWHVRLQIFTNFQLIKDLLLMSFLSSLDLNRAWELTSSIAAVWEFVAVSAR